MSIFESGHATTDFDRWIEQEFAATGPFTALVILVEITETKVSPICSTYMNVIGDDIGWDEIVVMFAGSGATWDGASFFPATAPMGGPLDNPTARLKLRQLESRLDDDRLVLNEGRFFDAKGRSLMVDEIALN